MADPRARISIGPPTPLGARPPDRAPARTIGKPHGRKRSVGVYLPAAARDALDSLAAEHACTLGDAAIWALNRLAPPDRTQSSAHRPSALPTRRRPGPRRKLDRPSVVYLLVESEQADALRRLADLEHTSVSELVTRALSSQPTSKTGTAD